MDLSNKRTGIMVAIAGLWVLCMVLGWQNRYVEGMCAGVVLMLLHMLLGFANKEIVSKKILIYPLAVWMGLWLAAFILAKYYADLFKGVMPTFTWLGLHPSFGATVFLYWIGGMLTLTWGFYVYADEWLSKKDWDDFVERMKQLKEEGK